MGLGALDQRLAKTDFFDLVGFHSVARNVIDTIHWPDELSDLHL